MNLLVYLFIKSLSIDSGIQLARKYNIEFNKDEATIIVPFLKENAHIMDLEHKKDLLKKIKPNVSQNTFGKIVLLLERLNF